MYMKSSVLLNLGRLHKTSFLKDRKRIFLIGLTERIPFTNDSYNKLKCSLFFKDGSFRIAMLIVNLIPYTLEEAKFKGNS